MEHDKAAAAIEALRTVYEEWWKNGLTQAEFDAIRSSWQGGRRDQRRAAPAVANQIVSALSRGYPVQYYAAADSIIDGMTLADLNAYIRLNFPPKLTIVAVSPDADVLGNACKIEKLDQIGRCGIQP